MPSPILVLGFESYGGRSLNPAEQVAKALDGRDIAGSPVLGRVVPVRYEGLASEVSRHIEDAAARIVIGIGLWPGEPMIRLERVAVNIADFEIPDNAGALVDASIEPGGLAAFQATLPIREIRDALLRAGIPVRLSGSAGTFLCNALMYHAMKACAGRTPRPAAGFVHLPYLPAQVSGMLIQMSRTAALEQHQRADFASMSLDMMIDAVSLAAEITAKSLV